MGLKGFDLSIPREATRNPEGGSDDVRNITIRKCAGCKAEHIDHASFKACLDMMDRKKTGHFDFCSYKCLKDWILVVSK